MFFRNVLLILGVTLMLGGLAIGYFWLTAEQAPVAEAKPAPPSPEPQAAKVSVLAAARDISAGTRLTAADVAWRDIEATELGTAHIVRNEASEETYHGAIAMRNLSSGQLLSSADFREKRNLAEALKPGRRAVSILVDPSQRSLYTLIEPGSSVDVVLTQSTDSPKGDVVSRTILQAIPVIAVDRVQAGQTGGALTTSIGLEAQLPKSVTLELTQAQAQTLLVAQQLGKIQLLLRALDNAQSDVATPDDPAPTWGGEISPTWMSTGSPLEANIRWPPINAPRPFRADDKRQEGAQLH